MDSVELICPRLKIHAYLFVACDIDRDYEECPQSALVLVAETEALLLKGEVVSEEMTALIAQIE